MINEDRIPKKTYLMLHKLDANGKRNWVSKVRECLFTSGFGYAGINQGVGDVNVFIRMLKQRLINCHWQNWNNHVNNSERFHMYNMFNGDSCSLPTYLQLDLDRHIKFIMTKFRFGISELYAHKFRYQLGNVNSLCPMCCNMKDNEIHFVLCCPVLQELRNEYIAQKFHRSPNACRLSILMTSNNSKTVRNLCIFLYKAFKIRETVIT